MKSFNWECPYCNRAQAVTEYQCSKERHEIDNSKSEFGHICCVVESIRCANDACKKLHLTFSLHHAKSNQYGRYCVPVKTIQQWRLLPESSAKPQPAHIPQQLVNDYNEACRIRDLSPKASATLARRCIQGMIRDFCDIKGGTLFQEIELLRKKVVDGEGILHVQQDTVDAIDYVRRIGKFGAHMEKDVNLIIDVEPNEAQKLIELIELLFDEWYVQRETRTQKIADLKKIAQDKGIISDSAHTTRHRLRVGRGVRTIATGAVSIRASSSIVFPSKWLTSVSSSMSALDGW